MNHTVREGLCSAGAQTLNVERPTLNAQCRTSNKAILNVQRSTPNAQWKRKIFYQSLITNRAKAR